MGQQLAESQYRRRPAAYGMAACVPVILLLVMAGCTASDGGATASTPADAKWVERTVQEGPVSLTLRAKRTRAAYTERVPVEVEAVAPANVTVTLDDYAATVADSGASGFEYKLVPQGRTAAEPAGEGRLRWQQQYELQFFVTGDYELPGATAHYVYGPASSSGDADAPAPADGTGDAAASPDDERLVTTEPLTVSATLPVTGGTDPDAEDQIALPDPRELPALPVDWWKWWWLPVAGGVAVLALVALLRAASRRRDHRQMARMIPPAEWALRALDALLRDGEAIEGDAREFYYRLTAIVREYVERGFDVAAPEQTTEEFLRNVRADVILGREDKQALGAFLAAGDLVKYARHQPSGDERTAAVDAGRAFIERTAERTRLLAAQAAVRSNGPAAEQAA